MGKLFTMQEKVNGVYQPLYPRTYWQQVIGADDQITTVNNRISTVQSNLQGQINNKQDASTAVNQGNLKSYVNITSGWYTGNGEANRTINLGFTPTCVIIFPNDGIIFGGYPTYSPRHVATYGGMAVTGQKASANHGGSLATLIEIITNGFTVHYLTNGSDRDADSAYTNSNNVVYFYLAVKQ